MKGKNQESLTKLQDRQCTYNVRLRRFRSIIILVGKQINITYSESVFVDLGIQDAMPVRHIVFCDFLCCTFFFLRYVINGTILDKSY